MNLNGMHFAHLDRDKLDRLQALEQKLGKSIVAVEPDPTYARLSREEIDELKQAEKELGVVLVAYEAN